MLNPGKPLFVILLGLVFATGALSTDMFAPAQPSIAVDLDSTPFGAQLLFSVFFAGYAVAQLVFGPLSDRFGRKPVLLAGLYIYAAATIACAFATSIEMLLTLRFVQGLAAASGTSIARAIARDHFQGRELGQALSYMSLTLSISPVILPPLGGLLTVGFGWQSNFVFLTGLIVALIAMTQVGLKESHQELNLHALAPRWIAAKWVQLLAHPTYFGFLMTGMLCFAGMFTFVTNASFVFIDYFGASTKAFGIYLGLASAGYTLGTLAGGRLVIRLGGDRLIKTGAVLCLVGSLGALFAGYDQQSGMWPFLLSLTVFMFGAGLVYPQATAGALGPFPQIAGTASAVMGFAVIMGSGAVSALAGRLYNGTPTPMATILVIMSALTLLFVSVVRLRLQRRREAGPIG